MVRINHWHCYTWTSRSGENVSDGMLPGGKLHSKMCMHVSLVIRLCKREFMLF